MQAHNQGNLDLAKQCYEQQLKLNPVDPNAQQLLGLVYSAKGNFELAIRYIRGSLAVNPNQPHVINNLAICLKKSGLYLEAQQEFQKAIFYKVDYFAPYKSLISLLLDSNNLKEAQEWVQKALNIFQGNVSVLSFHAEILQRQGKFSEALSIYQDLLNSNPDSTELRHNLALILRQLGKVKQALDNYLLLVRQGSSSYQLFHNTANAYSDLAQYQDAIRFYKKALECHAGYVESHINLNDLLWETDNKQEFLSSYVEAMKQLPENLELKYAYSRTLLRIKNFSQCRDFLAPFEALLCGSPEYLDLYARALKGMGLIDDSLALQCKAMDCPMDNIEPRLNYVQSLLENGDTEKALSHVKVALEHEPDNKLAWAFLGVCWRSLGTGSEGELNDYDNLVREYEIGIPSGFNNIEEFCSALNDYLELLHVATNQPLEQTLTGGTQTRGNLFDDQNPLIQAFIKEVHLCIDDYIKQTAPFSGRFPIINTSSDYQFSGSWSVKLRKHGHHTSHIHPMGWLSSAFYVRLPKTVSNTQAKEGWFKLGEPNLVLPQKLDAQKYIQPKVGKLVLFQSYMWHGTEAFSSDESRTTIAFDVVQR